MSDPDPERFTLRQAAQARDDFAVILDELASLREPLARLPTRAEVSWIALSSRLAP
jgi:hypothetical protein